jgi:hypothetical protein
MSKGQPNVLMSVHYLGRSSKRARREDVVGRQEEHVVGFRPTQPLIVGCDVSAVRLVFYDPDTMILVGKVPGDGRRVVR